MGFGDVHQTSLCELRPDRSNYKFPSLLEECQGDVFYCCISPARIWLGAKGVELRAISYPIKDFF